MLSIVSRFSFLILFSLFSYVHRSPFILFSLLSLVITFLALFSFIIYRSSLCSSLYSLYLSLLSMFIFIIIIQDYFIVISYWHILLITVLMINLYITLSIHTI